MISLTKEQMQIAVSVYEQKSNLVEQLNQLSRQYHAQKDSIENRISQFDQKLTEAGIKIRDGEEKTESRKYTTGAQVLALVVDLLKTKPEGMTVKELGQTLQVESGIIYSHLANLSKRDPNYPLVFCKNSKFEPGLYKMKQETNAPQF